MRHVVAASVVVMLTGCGSAKKQPVDERVADEPLRKYTSEEGKFAVRFPPGVTVNTKVATLPEHRTVALMAETMDAAYVVAYGDFSDNVELLPDDARLEGAQKGGLKAGGYTLVSAKPLEFGPEKLPGRDVVADSPDGRQRMWLRIVAKGRRNYTVSYFGQSDRVAEATAFIDSFEIIP